MHPYDPTSILLQRITQLEPENASRIVGYMLIKDLGSQYLMQLAVGPDNILHSMIHQAKTELGLISNLPSANYAPSPALNPIARPNSGSNSGSNGIMSFAANRGLGFGGSPFRGVSGSPFVSQDKVFPNYGGVVVGEDGGGDSTGGGGSMEHQGMNDYLLFLKDSSPNTEEFVEGMVDVHSHRRSFSASDVCIGFENGGIGKGNKPCLFFARGFCKKGDDCKFRHGGFSNNVHMNDVMARRMSYINHHQQQQYEELWRRKAAYRRRQGAAHLMAGASQFPYEKSMVLHPQHNPKRAALMHDRDALFLDEECFWSKTVARQIYLTFPAYSTFNDEDVSTYFSMFGPVQDVRIPYQTKRMFGFVTFHHSESVEKVLARGNPHTICGSRVLVKPYKEKSELMDRKSELIERTLFSPASNSSEIDSRGLSDFHLGAKSYYNSQEVLPTRNLEGQTDLQQAIELQSRKIMNLQLRDIESIPKHQRSFSVTSHPGFSSYVNQDFLSYGSTNEATLEPNCENPAATIIPIADQQLRSGVSATCTDSYGSDWISKFGKFDLHERSQEINIEHFLPDNLFIPPTSAVDGPPSDLLTSAEVDQDTKSSTST